MGRPPPDPGSGGSEKAAAFNPTTLLSSRRATAMDSSKLTVRSSHGFITVTAVPWRKVGVPAM